MSTWTKMKLENMVEIGWANLLKTHVVCKTVYGDMVESVPSLRLKLLSRELLPPIRKVFQDMLDFAEGKSD